MTHITFNVSPFSQAVVLVWLAMLLGCAQATRILTQETDCNKFMPGFTLPGPHLPGTGNAGSDQDCLKKCRDNPSCNAIVRPGDGRCILKKVATNVSPVPRPSSLKSYIICPSKGGSEPKKFFGFPKRETDKPAGIFVTKTGKCTWGEFSGGFDGFPSPAVGDGHEGALDEAVKQMFPGDKDTQDMFLRKCIDNSEPPLVNLNPNTPGHFEQADGGERARNIAKLGVACTNLISISCP